MTLPLLFLPVLAYLGYADWRWRRVPNWAVYSALIGVLALAPLTHGWGVPAGMVVASLPFLVAYRFGAGGGDVKMAALVGGLVGLTGLPVTLVAATLCAVAWVAIRRGYSTGVPMATFLALGACFEVILQV